MTLIEILFNATAWVLSTFGTVDNKCEEGANKMVELAAEAGFTLVRCRGFYGGGIMHNWTMDPITRDIYDPALMQFVEAENGYVSVSHPAYDQYDHVPDEDWKYFTLAPSSDYAWIWMALKDHRTNDIVDHLDLGMDEYCPICIDSMDGYMCPPCGWWHNNQSECKFELTDV